MVCFRLQRALLIPGLATAVLAGAGACRTIEPEAKPLQEKDQPVAGSTEWEHVGTISFSGGTAPSASSMEPYDVQRVGDELAVLYGENVPAAGSTVHTVYKAWMLPGASAFQPEALRPLTTTAGQVNGTRRYAFSPGNYTVLMLRHEGVPGAYASGLVNEEGHNLGTVQHALSARDLQRSLILQGGSVLMGGMGTAPGAEIHYFNRVSGAWTLSTVPDDSASLLSIAPFALADTRYTVQTRARREGICFEVSDIGSSGNATEAKRLFRNIRPEFRSAITGAFASFPEVIGLCAEDETLTVLAAHRAHRGDIEPPAAVSAYTWRRGDTLFKKLYGPVSLSQPVRTHLKNNASVSLLPTGTAYVWITDSAARTGALHVINSGGDRARGAANAANDKDAAYCIGAVRYFERHFWGIAIPPPGKDGVLRLKVVRLRD